MDYYATKIGINDISGDAEVITQVNVGALPANLWEAKVVCDSSGNAYYANANVLGKKAACLLTVSDNLVTHELTTSEERQLAFTNMMKIALEMAE